MQRLTETFKNMHIVNRGTGAGGSNTNKNGLPYEESEFRPDIIVNDFEQLCEKLGV